MWKKLTLLFLILIVGCNWNHPIDVDLLPDSVPIVELPYYETAASSGWEERGPEFTKWNSTGVQIDDGGSGTISYYDSKENYLYIISCGHLFFKGRGTVGYYKANPRTELIRVYYQNDVKLPKYKTYKAEVLCHVWENNIYDVSLLRFKPDWSDPWVIPVAPQDYQMQTGAWYHNIGCDGRSEVAHYLVKFSKYNIRSDAEELICVENVARGGRSGGGLITDDKMLVGITSRSDRQMTSYYSSYKQIHQFLKEEGFSFILDSTNWAQKIPIIDRNNPQNKYPIDYIPLPLKQ